MHGWGACANTHPLMIFRKSAIPSAFISFRIVHPTRIRPNVKPSTLGGRGSIYGDMGGVVAQKTQFLSLYTKCCAARQLRPSSALFLFVFVSPLNHLRVGGWITYRGLGAVYAQNATPSSICHFAPLSVFVSIDGFLLTRMGPPAAKPTIWRAEVRTGARAWYFRENVISSSICPFPCIRRRP